MMLFLRCVSLWAIWHARRKAIHEQNCQTPYGARHSITSYIKELDNCRPRSTTGSAQTTGTARARRVAPADGFFKIKVGGATSKTTTKGSYIAGDAMVKYMGSYAIKCTCIVDPATLEAIACREAPSLALGHSLSHVIIASDCQEVVTNIQGHGWTVWKHCQEINVTSLQLLRCSFLFEGREPNIEAHSPAKHGLGLLLGRHVWLLNPPALGCIPMYSVYDR